MTNKYDDARQNAQNWYDSDMGHMDYLEAVAAEDVEHLRKKEETYKEWEETPTEYKGLYYWGEEKWLMLDAYRHCWGKGP